MSNVKQALLAFFNYVRMGPDIILIGMRTQILHVHSIAQADSSLHQSYELSGDFYSVLQSTGSTIGAGAEPSDSTSTKAYSAPEPRIPYFEPKSHQAR